MMVSQLVVRTVVSRSFGQNAYLAHLAGRNDCAVIDPGFDAEQIQQALSENRLTPKAILNTHGHVDHIAGNAAIKRCWPDCPLVIGVNEAGKLTDPVANLSALHGSPITSPPADRLVHHGDTVDVAGAEFEVIDVPGHSAGHVVYVWKGGDPWLVFGGDVLFEGSVGRTDFPDGNAQQLFSCIRERLFTMPAETVVYPGHGGPTTIGNEMRFNPYVGGLV